MKRRFNMCRRLIVIGMIMLMELSLSSVWAFTQSYPSSGSGTLTPPGSAMPDYRFRSTSPLLDGSTPYSESGSPLSYGSNYGPILKGGLDDDPGGDDNPIGQVDDPLPVGEPYCLLLMAAAYCLFVYKRKKA